MITLKNIDVTFKSKKRVVEAVKNVDLQVDKGDVYGIVGYSGAGKSTLVRVINLLQKPTKGSIQVNDLDMLALNAKELRQARKKIGMIFQHFNLMNARTIYDNVAFPLKRSALTKTEKKAKIDSLLELVGLTEKAESYPSQLSGGQKQRVAIARALANDPEILLCDEATSALDPKTTLSILSLLKDLNAKLGLTIVLITHEMQAVKEICNKVAVMEEGHIIESGDIVSIFSAPKRPLTRDFIRTATHIDQALANILEHRHISFLNDNQVLAELSFVGDSAGDPIISKLYSSFNVTANILYGNVEYIQEIPLGTLVVILTGSDTERHEALDYLEKEEVGVQIIKKAGE